MNIAAIWTWLKGHWRTAVNTILSLSTAVSLGYGIITHNTNKRLSEELIIANNNIEAYLDALNGSLLASNVLKLNLAKYKESTDSVLNRLVNTAKENSIKPKEINVAATQSQVLDVTGSKGVRGDMVTILKDSTYQDSIDYNALTKVYYTIGKDTVDIRLKLENTQYLYTYSKKEYKNKKNFFLRLFTLDWKKVRKYKYKIINSNDLIKTDSVRVVENTDL